MADSASIPHGDRVTMMTAGKSLSRREPTCVQNSAWFKKCHFQATPEIDRALMVKGFLVLGVTLI